MAFFVVARTLDGNLQLVSPSVFASRQAAMVALSEAAQDPAFGLWDAELLVVDLDPSVPILLVRPTRAEPEEQRADAVPDEVTQPEEPVAEQEDEVFAELAAELAAELDAEETEIEEVGVLEPIREEASSDVTAEVASDEAAPLDASAEVASEEAGPAEMPAAEAASAEELPPAEPAESEVEVFDFDEIVLGETVGEEIVVEAIIETAADADFDEAVIIAKEMDETTAAADAAPADAIVSDLDSADLGAEADAVVSIGSRLGIDDQPDAGVPAWTPEPEASAMDEGGPEVETPMSEVAAAPGDAQQQEAEDGVVIAWPWDMDEPVGDSSIAEAIIADIELVTPPAEGVEDVPEEDEDLDSLLVDPTPASEALVTVSIETVEVEEALDAAEVDEADLAAPAETIVVGSTREEIADFIFDLENVTDIPEAVSARRGVDGQGSEGPTCDECVYDETCPNRDLRTPQECGSFQWKIA